MSTTQPVRFFVLSDTHEYNPETATPTDGFRANSLPQNIDVVLHCGDLTKNGRLESYEKVIEMPGSIDAELKLVIAGNHDLSLHKDFFLAEGGSIAEHEEALDLWKGPVAYDQGIRFLEEGTHTFVLRNGSSFTVYASPWTPQYGKSAFQYPSGDDRFNAESPAWVKNVHTPKSLISSHTNIDIMMTHGPPKYILDRTNDNSAAGCDHLRRAVCRARPRLHAFGHVHVGWGAQKVAWNTDVELKVGQEEECLVMMPAEFTGPVSTLRRGYATVRTDGMVKGEETLSVNAAIDNEPNSNAPWLISLELPVVGGGTSHGGINSGWGE